MAKTLASAAYLIGNPLPDIIRSLVVGTCALAMILSNQALPF